MKKMLPLIFYKEINVKNDPKIFTRMRKVLNLPQNDDKLIQYFINSAKMKNYECV